MHIDIKTMKKNQRNNYYKIQLGRESLFYRLKWLIGWFECLLQKIWSQAGGPALRTEVVFSGKVEPLNWKWGWRLRGGVDVQGTGGILVWTHHRYRGRKVGGAWPVLRRPRTWVGRELAVPQTVRSWPGAGGEAWKPGWGIQRPPLNLSIFIFNIVVAGWIYFMKF